MNSQVGFWGVNLVRLWHHPLADEILWRTSSHLRDEADLFRLLCDILF